MYYFCKTQVLFLTSPIDLISACGVDMTEPRRLRLLESKVLQAHADCNTFVDAMIMGDFNFTSASEEDTIFDGGFTDVWTALGAGDKCWLTSAIG